MRWPLMAEEIGGEGAASAGTGEAGQQGQGAGAGQGAPPSTANLLGQDQPGLLDWRHGLPDAVRDANIVKRHNSVEAAAKTLIEQERLLGASIQLPKGEKDSQDYLASVQKFQETLRKHDASLAMPDKADDYTLNAPEGRSMDDQFLGDLKRAFYDAGITQGQAEKVMGAYWQLVGKADNLRAAQAEVSKVDGQKALQAEFGANTQIMQAKARQAFRHLGKGMFNGEGGEKAGQALEEAMLEDGTPLLNVPEVVAALSGIIDRIGESEFLDSGDYVTGQSTLETYQKEFDALQAKRMNGTITPQEQERQNRLAHTLSRPGASNGSQTNGHRQPAASFQEFHMVGGRLA